MDGSQAPVRPSFRQLYAQRHMAVLLGLGFASGLPSQWKLLGGTLQSWLIDVGVDARSVVLFQLVGLPFALHFLWAPLLDRYVPPVLGRRRGWLLLIQLLLILGIAGLSLAGPAGATDALWPLVAAGLAVAFLAASQDTVADAYRTDILSPRDLAAGAAVFINGYRLAMITAGGGALLLSTVLPWRIVYLLLAAAMLPGVVATLLAREPDHAAPPVTLTDAVVQPVRDFARRLGWAALAVFAFVVLFKLPDALVNAVAVPLLQDHLRFSKAQIACTREWFGLGMSITGALAGGALVPWLGMVRSLWLFGALQALSNLGYLLLLLAGGNVVLLWGVMGVESFCAGLVAAGFTACLMSLCNPNYSATQYAVFTSLMAGTATLATLPALWLRDHGGYAWLLIVSILAALPGMAVLLWISQVLRQSQSRATQAPEP